MPIHLKPNEVIFPKKVKLPSGYNTLALFARNQKTGKVRFIEHRVCEELPSGKFRCPRLATQPQERKALARKIGLYKEIYGGLKKLYNNIMLREYGRQPIVIMRGGAMGLPITYNTQRQGMVYADQAHPLGAVPIDTLMNTTDAWGYRRAGARKKRVKKRRTRKL